MIHSEPIKGKIYKVKLRSGRTWLFKSDYRGYYLTEHTSAYCIGDGGNDYFHERICLDRGRHVGENEDILLLKPANLNEIAIFKRKVGC